MNALDLLTADHNRVRGLFTRLRSAIEDENTAEMASLYAKVAEELRIHTAIEEEIFYPAVHDTDSEIASTVDEGLEEHHVVDVLMEEISTLEPGADTWVAKVTVLMENVEHHAEEEESELFPPVRSEWPAERLDQMGEQLDSRKGELGGHTLSETIDLTVSELREMASHQEIPGRSSMGHDELAATVAPE